MVTNILDLKGLQGKDVFTDKGMYCGKVEDVELDLTKFRIRAVVVAIAKGSYLEAELGGKKGVIVPYPMIKAIGDVMIIKHITVGSGEEAI
jgi:sporulation protein YlmC with PRC-barrel domain